MPPFFHPLQVLRVLLAAGANANAICDSNLSALDYVAMSNGDADSARILLQAGAEVEGVDEVTPLFRACERGNLEVSSGRWLQQRRISYGGARLHVNC